MKIEVSLTDKSIFELTTTVYDDAQLSEISEFTGTMKELNSIYPIECLREDDGYYWVKYLGNRKFVSHVFDSSGNILPSGKGIIKMSLPKSAFDALTVGQSLEDVMRMDPDGSYVLLYVERNDLPRISGHYTTDGYKISIEYDYSNTIIRIETELI